MAGTSAFALAHAAAARTLHLTPQQLRNKQAAMAASQCGARTSGPVMQTLRVTFYNNQGPGASYKAAIVATDPSNDLAVLQLQNPRADLEPIKVGSSEGLRVGQYAFAIGNPSSLSSTLTCGVVSGLHRAIPSPTGTRIAGAIQTDANIDASAHRSAFADSHGCESPAQLPLC